MVKPELIKARLKAKYPKANLSNERIDEISARLCKLPEDDADETAIDAVVDQANNFMPFEDIAKNDDTLRTLKAKTEKSKTPEEIVAEATAKQKAIDDAKAKEDAINDAPDWFKKYVEANDAKLDKLSSSYDEIKSGITTDTKTQKLNKLFEANEVLKGLPEPIKNRALRTVNLDTDDLESEVAAISKDFEGFVQATANSNEFAGAPGKSFSSVGPSDKEVDALAEKLIKI